jgi:hypothetical protein
MIFFQSAKRLDRWQWAALWVVGLAVINQLMYARYATIPLLQGDSWIYLQGWLGRMLSGRGEWIDLFVQPNRDMTNFFFHKLLTWINVKFFDLDFSLEGTVGALGAIALAAMVVARTVGIRPMDWRLRDVAFTSAATLFTLTLASTNIYSWGLVTLWFVWLAMAVAAFLLLDRCSTTPPTLVASGLVVGLALDEPAIAVILPASIVAIMCGERGFNRARMLSLACFAAGILASALVYAIANDLAGLPAAESRRAGFRVIGSLEFWWAFLTVPFSEAVFPSENRARVFGASADVTSAAMAVFALLFQGLFWAFVLRRLQRQALPPALRLAVFLVLVSYAMVIGIGHQRLAQFGIDYLSQPRYVVFYLLQILGLLIAAHQAWPEDARRWARSIAVTGIGALLGLQAVHATVAWRHTVHLRAYVVDAALIFGDMDRDPSIVPSRCPDIFDPCRWDTASRRQAMESLRVAGVNLHSPAFRSRHELTMQSDALLAPVAP